MDFESCPRKHQIDTYLREHKINELFQNMTSLLIFNQPDYPKRFLREKLIELRDARDKGMDPPLLFTQDNAESIFNMLDPCESEAIAYERYCHALETLGIRKYDKDPEREENGEVKKERYLEEAVRGLKILATTYQQP
ncbi:unnamed protein product [Calicophoron daubneyi]|uniref:EFCAB10 C-terminal EF-hand domain-containing protein n=1 Tax=Calicophoron daubneyi TaxID=300641 RepID=A0AAV2TZD1_CALDB